MINESNIKKVGYGSWWASQSYNDYRDFMSYEEYRKHIYRICEQRIRSFNLQDGDLIKIEIIGRSTIRNYSGEFERLSGDLIYLRQKKRTVQFEVYFIDELEVLKRNNNKVTAKVYNFNDYLQ